MIVDLLKLRKSRLDFTLEFNPEKIDLDTEFATILTPVRFDGKLLKKEIRTEIKGQILTNVMYLSMFEHKELANYN